MKKLITIMLILSQTNGAFASVLACRDLFTTLDSQQLNPNAPSAEIQAQLDAYEILSFTKSPGFLRRMYQKMGGAPAAAVQFDLVSFHEKVRFYLEKLANSGSDQGDLSPKSLEEALALIHAQNILHPTDNLIDVIPKWLASADARNVIEMRKLLAYRDSKEPTKVYKAMAKLILLAESRPESFKDILKLDLDERAAEIITQQASIVVLSNSIEDAHKILHIGKPTGIKAFIDRATDKYPNLSTYSVNAAIATVELATFHGLVFTSINELKLLNGPLEKLTEAQLQQIKKGDLNGLPPGVQKHLVKIAKSQILWRRFIQVLGIAGLAYMLYLIEDKVQHDYFSNMPKEQRQNLETVVLGIYVASLMLRHQGFPTPEELENQRVQIRSASDADLEKTVNAQGYLVAQAAAMFDNPKSLAAVPKGAPVNAQTQAPAQVAGAVSGQISGQQGPAVSAPQPQAGAQAAAPSDDDDDE